MRKSKFSETQIVEMLKDDHQKGLSGMTARSDNPGVWYPPP